MFQITRIVRTFYHGFSTSCIQQIYPRTTCFPIHLHLPEETLRFFVDENWTDALVDGALGLANHWGAKPAEDNGRTAIKQLISERLATPDPKLGLLEMPRYGFFLQSQLLVQFSDLNVAVRYAETVLNRVNDNGDLLPPPTPILIQKRIGADCMYCLFDCQPPDLEGYTFTLPPHQQCFTVGQSLSIKSVTVLYKRVYTISKVRKPVERGIPLEQPETYEAKDGMFDWTSRALMVKPFAEHQLKKLRTGPGDEFTDTRSTSALLAVQLNDPILQLNIGDLTSLDALSIPRPGIFQLSGPHVTQIETPPLFPPVEKLQSPKCVVPVRRPRALSLRREAALVAQNIVSLRLLQPGPSVINADRPVFTLAVYPVTTRGFVPSNSPLPIDLVFSIRQRTDAPPPRSTVRLHRIFVEVPYGNMPSNTRGGPKDPLIPLLAENADPPVPNMLSNLRFNVIKRWREDDKKRGKYLVLELVPRTKKGVLVHKVMDASFLLSRALIVPYFGKDEREPWVSLKYDYGDWGDKTWNDGTRVTLKPA
jgi:hypothetical protein